MSEIKKSIDSIEIPDGAEERMYNNILKKSAKEKAAPKRSNIRIYTAVGAAACIAVICTAAVMTNVLRNDDISVPSDTSAKTDVSAEITTENTVGDEAAELNPFGDDYSLEDIAQLGINFVLPKDAEFNMCAFYDGLADIRYYYIVSESDEDFSGVYGNIKESETMSDENEIILDITEDGYFKAHWSGEKFNYYLCNTDNAEKSDVLTMISETAAQAQ